MISYLLNKGGLFQISFTEEVSFHGTVKSFMKNGGRLWKVSDSTSQAEMPPSQSALSSAIGSRQGFCEFDTQHNLEPDDWKEPFQKGPRDVKEGGESKI